MCFSSKLTSTVHMTSNTIRMSDNSFDYCELITRSKQREQCMSGWRWLWPWSLKTVQPTDCRSMLLESANTTAVFVEKGERTNGLEQLYRQSLLKHRSDLHGSHETCNVCAIEYFCNSRPIKQTGSNTSQPSRCAYTSSLVKKLGLRSSKLWHSLLR